MGGKNRRQGRPPPSAAEAPPSTAARGDTARTEEGHTATPSLELPVLYTLPDVTLWQSTRRQEESPAEGPSRYAMAERAVDERRHLHDYGSDRMDAWADAALLQRIVQLVGTTHGETTARLIHEINYTRRAYVSTVASLDMFFRRQLSMTIDGMQDNSRRLHALFMEQRNVMQGLQEETRSLRVHLALLQSAVEDMQGQLHSLQRIRVQLQPNGMITPRSIDQSDAGSFTSALSHEEMVDRAQQIAHQLRRPGADDLVTYARASGPF